MGGEPGDGLGLAAKPTPLAGVVDVVPEHLDGDVPLEGILAGEVHVGGPA
jgi:hypothetical protein